MANAQTDVQAFRQSSCIKGRGMTTRVPGRSGLITTQTSRVSSKASSPITSGGRTSWFFGSLTLRGPDGGGREISTTTW